MLCKTMKIICVSVRTEYPDAISRRKLKAISNLLCLLVIGMGSVSCGGGSMAAQRNQPILSQIDVTGSSGVSIPVGGTGQFTATGQYSTTGD